MGLKVAADSDRLRAIVVISMSGTGRAAMDKGEVHWASVSQHNGRLVARMRGKQ